MALHQGIGLIKLDKESNLLWAERNGAHHDFEVGDNGEIYVLTREAKIIPRINPDSLVLEPLLDVLAADGTRFKRISLLEWFEQSTFAPLLAELPEEGDLFHTNTIEVFDGSHAETSPLFKKGNVMISIWSLSTVAILDMERETVIWISKGMWRHQHQPTLLDSGNMLIFDNQGPGTQSQVIEFEPFTQEVLWRYRGSVEEPFYTEYCGSSQRLPNGNTLITESNNGRAFEVTPDKEIVWEFINPHRVTEEGVTMIRTLWEVVRLEPDFGRSWIPRGLMLTSK